jgi:hypothetical protein
MASPIVWLLPESYARLSIIQRGSRRIIPDYQRAATKLLRKPALIGGRGRRIYPSLLHDEAA